MRDRGMVMLFGGLILLLLTLYSCTGAVNAATQVGDALAIGTSSLVSLTGLTCLLLARRHDADQPK